MKSPPEYVSFHFEQYKSLTTPLTVLIAVNTGLAYFGWNQESKGYFISFLGLSGLFLILLLINAYLIQSTVVDLFKAKKIDSDRDPRKEYLLTNEELGFIKTTFPSYQTHLHRFLRVFFLCIGINLAAFLNFSYYLLTTIL